MIILVRHDPAKNVNRWYAVGIQPTLFCPHAVLCGWGRRGTAYARWRILPTENRQQAEQLASEIVAEKRKKGYLAAGDQGEERS